MAVTHKGLWKAPFPHTKAKHKILKQYLQAWFPIMATTNERIIYVDGFCGRGRYENGDLGSPLIALNAALNCPIPLTAKLVFRFIDNNLEEIEKLEKEIENLREAKSFPKNFDVKARYGNFQETILEIIDYFEKKNQKFPPSFVFIDPFAIKGVSFPVIEKLLKQRKCEFLINFMVGTLNRCLRSPDEKTKKRALDFLGTREDPCITMSSGDRKQCLKVYYGQKLRQSAHYVRHFEMRNLKRSTIYYLFFATNHPKGHYKMKKAMWTVDPGGDFVFSDATDPSQVTLFKNECIIPNLTLALERRYKGKGVVQCDEIIRFIIDGPLFLKEHMTITLRELELSGKIDVDPIKSDGSKRRAHSFSPEVKLRFV